MKEPLNLPNGSVRAILALIALGTSAFLWATGQVVPSELLIITATVVTFYYSTRDGEPLRDPEVKIPEPYVGNEDD